MAQIALKCILHKFLQLPACFSLCDTWFIHQVFLCGFNSVHKCDLLLLVEVNQFGLLELKLCRLKHRPFRKSESKLICVYLDQFEFETLLYHFLIRFSLILPFCEVRCELLAHCSMHRVTSRSLIMILGSCTCYCYVLCCSLYSKLLIVFKLDFHSINFALFFHILQRLKC